MLRPAFLLLAGTLSFAAISGDLLSADEVKKLITDKTVHVTVNDNGQQMKFYFAPDGRGYETGNRVIGMWEVRDNGEHCASWSALKCARIENLGNGQYGRLNPAGKAVLTWTKFEDGNKL